MTEFPIWLVALVAAGFAPFVVKLVADHVEARRRHATEQRLAEIAAVRPSLGAPDASGATLTSAPASHSSRHVDSESHSESHSESLSQSGSHAHSRDATEARENAAAHGPHHASLASHGDAPEIGANLAKLSNHAGRARS